MKDEMFRELLEGTGMQYLLCEAGSYELVYVSPGFLKLLPELRDRIVPGYSVKYVLDYVEAHSDKERSVEQSVLRLTEPERFYGVSRKSFTVGGIPMIALYVLNIEAEIRRERAKKEELARNVEEIRKVSEAKTLLMTRISRDIRTPLATITGFAELLREEVDLSGPAGEYLSSIAASGERAKRVIDEMLEIQRIEGKAVQLSPDPLEVRSFVRRIETVLRPRVQEKGLHFSCGVRNLITQKVKADRAALELVITKLVRNALTCTPKGGAIELSISENVRRGEMATLTFTVSDNGIGMSRERIDEILGKGPIVKPEQDFAAGIRLDTEIARSYIKAMGGTMSIESEEGRGTKAQVTFAFPIAYERKDRVQEGVVNSRIMVVDDHELSRTIAAKMLTRAGYEVEMCEDGAEAVKRFSLEQGNFALVLMDIRMPVMDGLEAARAIRNLELPNAGNVPIFAMTASAFEEDIRQSLDAGMNEHLSKPINPRNLYELVEKYIHPGK
ncbi:MAG: response regulator [Lachnospiraceae bacterium]|nr:response regulator [Lachnospiraceae bacterium]